MRPLGQQRTAGHRGPRCPWHPEPHHPPAEAPCLDDAAAQVGHVVLLGAGQLGRLAPGRSRRQLCERLPHLDRCDGPGTHPGDERDRAGSAGQRLVGELVELGRTQDRGGNGAGEGELLLSALALVVAEVDLVDPDDGEHDQVGNPGPLGGAAQVAARGLEEAHGGAPAQRHDVGDVDDAPDSVECPVEPGAGGEVDAGRPRQHHRLVPGGAEGLHDVPTDQAGASGDRDAHDLSMPTAPPGRQSSGQSSRPVAVSGSSARRRRR